MSAVQTPGIRSSYAAHIPSYGQFTASIAKIPCPKNGEQKKVEQFAPAALKDKHTELLESYTKDVRNEYDRSLNIQVSMKAFW